MEARSLDRRKWHRAYGTVAFLPHECTTAPAEKEGRERGSDKPRVIRRMTLNEARGHCRAAASRLSIHAKSREARAKRNEGRLMRPRRVRKLKTIRVTKRPTRAVRAPSPCPPRRSRNVIRVGREGSPTSRFLRTRARAYRTVFRFGIITCFRRDAGGTRDYSVGNRSAL